MTAWFVGRLYGQDLREVHSGNLGARNAGRTFGKSAFALTALGDVAKGIVVVIAGRYLELSERLVAASVLAVVCGHLYPFWLKGRGGKGVATVLGAMLAFHLPASALFIVSFAVIFSLKRSATLSLLAGFVLYSGAIIYGHVAGWPFVVLAITLVIWKHRSNILKRVR